MSNVIAVDFQADDAVWENIQVDVAIAPTAEKITIDGAGTVDFYPMQNSVGMTVTASSGLTVLVSIPNFAAEEVFSWLVKSARSR